MRVILIGDNNHELALIETLIYKNFISGLVIDKYIEAKESIFQTFYDIIIFSISTLDCDTISLISKARKFNRVSPLIAVLQESNQNMEIDLLEIGVSDFLYRPLDEKLFNAKIRNITRFRQKLSLKMSLDAIRQTQVSTLIEDIEKREVETLNMLSRLAEFKDPETGGHVERVAIYSRIITKQKGMEEEFQDLIYKAAPLHDIGKVGIPDYILLKTGKLEKEEWSRMKEHCKIGFQILSKTKSPILQAGATISMAHHEKFDGTGYPFGLKGVAIPLIGRIVAISDVFDALTSERSYKKAWGFEEAVNEITSLATIHFDPELVECFIQSSEKIKEVYLKHREASKSVVNKI